MMNPVTTSEALLTLLREHMPSAVIVNDEFQYLVAEVDPARPHQPLNLDFSNSISLWRRMKPATAVFSGNKGQIGSGRSAVV
jgi:hypothetical protein